MPRVFVTRIIPEIGLNRIKQHCDAEIWHDPLPPAYAVLRQKVADCDGLVSLLTDKVDAALLDSAPRLRVVSNFAVGFNNIDVSAATARGIAVGNTPGVLTDATADVRRNETAERDLKAQFVDLDTLLGEADFVSVHTDLNDQTQGLFNEERFRKMKRTAVFINTARGPIVDQKALYIALRSGTIFAAGLDVTDPEPPAMDNPLLGLPNVIVAPHIASATVGTRNAMAEICANNLIAGLSGAKLPAWVNPEVEANRRRSPA
jgi:lactate dehydrogenase-like 2-hydroxyacid dehydrogenase